MPALPAYGASVIYLFCNLLRKADAFAGPNRSGWLSVVSRSRLIIENHLARLLVPNLEPEFIDSATLRRLTVDHGQEIFETSFIVNFTGALKLRARAGKFTVI